MQKPEFYTVEEVANIFRVSEQTIRLWIRRGKLTSTKVGRAHLIPSTSVDKLRSGNGDAEEGEGELRVPVSLAIAYNH